VISPKRFEIYLVALDPVMGSEIAKTRPCVILSPDEMNGPLNTVIIAPMTRSHKQWPSRIVVTFQKKGGDIALDQIRTVSKKRLLKKLGTLSSHYHAELLQRLQDMFS